MANYMTCAIWAFCAGILIPVMMIFNAHLGRALGNPAIAVSVLLCTGLLGSLVYLAFVHPALPPMSAWTALPIKYFSGGLIVAFYILSVTFLAPRFGVSNTVLFVVTAQLCSSAMIDAWGLFGADIRPITITRIIGVLIVFAGVVITQLGNTTAQNP